MSLALTHLSGFGGAVSSDAPPIVSYVTSRSINSAGSSWSNSDSLGDADTTRKIIVAIAWGGSAERTISALTVAGVSATQIKASENNTDSMGCATAIWIASVPTGTSGTIAVTFSGNVDWGAYSIYRVINLNSSTEYAKTSVLSGSSGVVSGSINIPTNGFAIAMAATINPYHGEGGTGTSTFSSWSNATENFDSMEIAFAFVAGSALRTVSSAETGTVISATHTMPGSYMAMTLASFGD